MNTRTILRTGTNFPNLQSSAAKIPNCGVGVALRTTGYAAAAPPCNLKFLLASFLEICARSQYMLLVLAAFLFCFPPRAAGNPFDGSHVTVSFGEPYGKNRTVKKGDTVTVYVTCSCNQNDPSGAYELSLDGVLRGSASASTLTVSGTADKVGEFELKGVCSGQNECAPPAGYAILKVVDFEIRIIFDDDFAGRSRDKAGITERGRVVVDAKDGSDIFPMEELKISQGANSLEFISVNTTAGTAIFKAAFKDGTAVIEAKVKGGVTGTYEIEIIKPDGVIIEREPETGIYHEQGYALCGFKARAYLQPHNVSFKGLKVKEGYAKAEISGYFSYQIGKSDVHRAGDWFVFGSAVPGKGTKDNAIDIIHAVSDNHTPYVDGKFTWEIPWLYQGEGGAEIRFATVSHVKEIDGTGRITISKGETSVSAGLDDPTSDY